MIDKKDVSMDLVINFSLKILDDIAEKVILSESEKDALYDRLEETLEKFFNYPDYSSWN